MLAFDFCNHDLAQKQGALFSLRLDQFEYIQHGFNGNKFIQ